jgi:DnaJ-class molecular chaperone
MTTVLHDFRLFAALTAALILASPVVAQETGEAPAKREINCTRCHDDVTLGSGSVHEGQECQACHSNVEKPRHKAEDLADLSGDAICAQCHGMASRQLPKSVHGDVAECTDCHGAPHDIREPSDLAPTISPANQLDTCGGCHGKQEGLVDAFGDSVHGRGL